MTAPICRFSMVALAITLVLTACGGDDSVGVADITSVAVTPGTATLVSLGATEQLSASASAGGAAVGDITFTWSSSDASVATVNASGLVTAVANGTATGVKEALQIGEYTADPRLVAVIGFADRPPICEAAL